MKKVSFASKPPSTAVPPHADDWVRDRDAKSSAPTKRLTINVPLSLHTRVKAQCALNGLVIADVVRDLLERRFLPDSVRSAPEDVDATSRMYDDTIPHKDDGR